MKDPANWATAFRVGLIVGATVGAFVVPILVICALTYPVTIRASGVSSYNPYGTWKEESLSWQEMREVRPTRVLGVRYLRVESSRGAPLWIPSRALENGDFTAAVLRYSPSGGPLAQYLSTPA